MESLREICEKELLEYEKNDLLDPEEKENAEKILRAAWDRLWYASSFDEKAAMIKIANCYKHILSKKQKEAFLSGLSLGVTYLAEKCEK